MRSPIERAVGRFSVPAAVLAVFAAASGCSLDKLLTESKTTDGDPSTGAPVRLEFTAEPTATPAGAVVSPPVQVTAVDGSGRRSTTFVGTVTISLDGGGAGLRGTLSRTADSGIAVFADLSLVKTGAGYRLQASADSLAAAVSAPFDVEPAVAARLARASGDGQSDTVAATLADPYEVVITDRFGNPVPGVTVEWTVKTGGGRIDPATVPTDAQGSARSRHTLGTTPGPQSVIATGTGVPGGGVTFSATARHAAVAVLRFTQQPSSVQAKDRIAPPVTVLAEDQFGNPATGFGGPVTMSLTPGTGDPGAILSGTLVAAAAQGVASFPDLRIDRPSNDYRLRAAAQGLTTDSQPFPVRGKHGRGGS